MPRTTGAMLAVVAVAVVAAGALFLLRDRTTGDADALQVGDCVQLPDAGAIAELEHRPCSQSHEAEIFHIVDVPAQDAYPTEAELEAFFGEACLDAPFLAYTGVSFDDAPDIDIGYLPPAESAWAQGRRMFVCYLHPAGGGEVDRSYRKG
jgi:hypothetical protein